MASSSSSSPLLWTLVLAVLAVLVGTASATGEWWRLIGTASSDVARGVTFDSHGNVIVCGETSAAFDGQTHIGSKDIFLTKYDADGVQKWSKQSGTAGDDICYSVVTDSSDNIYITGSTAAALDLQIAVGGLDIFVTKWTSDGTKVWTRQYGTVTDDAGLVIQIDPNNDLYIAGYTTGILNGAPAVGSQDIFLLKMNTVGSPIWTNVMGSTADSDVPADMSIDSDGNVIVAGTVYGAMDGEPFLGTTYSAFVTKYDSDGVRAWTRLEGDDASAQAVTTDKSDKIYVSGLNANALHGEAAGSFLFSFGSDGTYVVGSTKTWASSDSTNDEVAAISVDKYVNIYILGSTTGDLAGITNGGGRDVFVRMYDSTFAEIGTYLHAAGGIQTAFDMAINKITDELAAVGSTTASIDGKSYSASEDAFIWKFTGGYYCGWYQTSANDFLGANNLNPGACVSSGSCYFCSSTTFTGSCQSMFATCPSTAHKFAIPLDNVPYEWQRGEVYPNKFAYYSITPKNRYLVLRIVAQTVTDDGIKLDTRNLGDNLDLYVKKALATTISTSDRPRYGVGNWDFTSNKESNPWSIDISQSAIASQCTLSVCKPFLIGVMGDNQYPQKSGASQYQIKAYLEFEFPDFDCDTVGGGATWHDKCMDNIVRYDVPSASDNVPGFVLPNSGSNDAKFYQTGKSISLIDSVDMSKVGGLFYSEKLLLDEGFESTFKFKISAQSRCGTPDGFCGGGDGFSFVIFNPDDSEDHLTIGGSWLGPDGEQMAFTDVPRSVAIEFDTWNNPDFYDPKQGIEHWWINATEYVSYADNHLAFFSYGGLPNSADHSSDALLAATPSIPNLSDGEIHTVKMWYLPRAGTFSGSLSVWIDDMNQQALVTDVTFERQHMDSSTGGTCKSAYSWASFFDVYVGQIADTTTYTVTAADDSLRISPREFNRTTANWRTPQRIRVGIDRDTVTDTTPNPIAVTVKNKETDVTLTTVNVAWVDTWSAAIVIVKTSRDTGIISCNDEITEELTVQLSKSPADNEEVTISITDATSKITFDPTTLTFTADDWNNPKRIRILSIDPLTCHTGSTLSTTASLAVTGVSNSKVYTTSSEFQTGATPFSYPVKILPQDGLYITYVGGETTVRKQDTTMKAHFNVRLVKNPGGSVDITFGDAGSTFVVVNTGGWSDTLTFTTANWNKQQTVQVTSNAGSAGGNAAIMVTQCNGAGCPQYVDNSFVVKTVDPSADDAEVSYPFSSVRVLPYETDRCVVDQDGKAYIGFVASTGWAAQRMEITSWSFCHKPGCVAY